MILSDLEGDLLRRFGFNTSSVDTATKARLDAFLNETQQEILSEPGMEILLRDRTSFDSARSTPEYALARGVASISAIRDTTNDRLLIPMAYEEYLALSPDPLSSSGTPTHWVDAGWSAMVSQPKEYSRQPANASELFVVSTDNTDDIGATKKAYLEGYDNDGDFHAVSVAVNGTTGASFDATITDWVSVTRFYLDFVPSGVVTLREDNTAGTELGRQPVATELWVKSSDNATDTGAAKHAYIEGYVSGGYYVSSGAVDVNGTTGTSFGATITTWTHITKFYLDFTPVGNVTIRQVVAAGHELSRIPISQTQGRYRKIALVPCPDSALTYTVECQREVPAMSAANDEPVIPVQFHRLLATGARMKEYEKQDQMARYDKAEKEFTKGMRKLKRFAFAASSGSLNLRGSQFGAPSQLGAWYPAGS
jgi:hypothetical protein